MGSFNLVCSISELPIIPGDKVKISLLQENPFKGLEGEITDEWFPRTFPLSGTYEDYGDVSVIENWESSLWVRGFQKDNCTSDSFQNVLRSVQEGSVSVKKSKGANKSDLQIKSFIVRQDVWDLLLDTPIHCIWSQTVPFEEFEIMARKDLLIILNYRDKICDCDPILSFLLTKNLFGVEGILSHFLFLKNDLKIISNEEKSHYLKMICEMSFITYHLQLLSKTLKPSKNGGQQTFYPERIEVYKKILRLTEILERLERDEYNRE